jgi:hypothetical protein
LAGCGGEGTGHKTSESESTITTSLIADADRQYNFGAVIGRPEQKVDHRYRLINAAQHDVKIVNVINHKTCCGIVQVGNSVLRPGETTDVVVTLVVGDKFGEVVHETEVVTDQASDSNIILRTTAEAIPAFRIEEQSSSAEPIVMGTREPRRAEFRVFASGTETDPPANLDRAELRSTIKAEWVGAKTLNPSEDGLSVESRAFTALLDGTGSPGYRKAEILLQDGKQVLDRYVVSWEVVAPIVASPKVIVLSPGKREYHFVIRSRDKTSFRVTRIECGDPGLKPGAANPTSAVTQTVELEGVPEKGSRQGVVTVYTDHPAQGKIEVPFLLID